MEWVMLRRLPVLCLLLLGLLAGAWHATAMAAPQPRAAEATMTATMAHADCHEAAMADPGTAAPETNDHHKAPGCCDGACLGGCLMAAQLPIATRPEVPMALPARFALASSLAPPAGLPLALFHPPRAFA
jgi:hypothetical protein